mmetsp:Transcript_33781/g.132774  ORF Transcript_33781/g.132774 Transcript_33781/m.132774 type:complete len:120 (+) Transcript_33781:760-1119(+)
MEVEGFPNACVPRKSSVLSGFGGRGECHFSFADEVWLRLPMRPRRGSDYEEYSGESLAQAVALSLSSIWLDLAFFFSAVVRSTVLSQLELDEAEPHRERTTPLKHLTTNPNCSLNHCCF